jgi:two-component system aerobic respiration control sensor histidine kinase ArcB
MDIHLKRILVVEDTLIAQIAETNVLEELNCLVTLANTGREAIDKTNQGQDYDLILMDLGLPDVDSLTVTENIIANYARHKKSPPPIIALTAHDCTSLKTHCMNAGMSDFLAKPLTKDVAKMLLEKY